MSLNACNSTDFYFSQILTNLSLFGGKTLLGGRVLSHFLLLCSQSANGQTMSSAVTIVRIEDSIGTGT